MPLTPRQTRFVDEFLLDLNASKAAVRAGYSNSAGYQLLGIAEVAEAIATAKAERSRRTKLDQDRVLREIGYLALSNIDDYEIDDEDGRVRLSSAARRHAMRAVSSIKRRVFFDPMGGKRIETEIKLWDKPAALRMAGQHLGMFVERHQHGGDPKGTPIRVVRADELTDDQLAAIIAAGGPDE